LSEDPLGLNSGDVNPYRYVRNNPISYRDPSGLKLEYGCELARKEFEDDIEAIRSTADGKKLLEYLENSDTVFKINRSWKRELVYRRSENSVYIDPNVNPNIWTNQGYRPASTTRILAHELGHAAGANDEGFQRMENVTTWENSIMGPLEGFSRYAY
jgi:uncharacterized protein RhaS with RHS repeats